MVEPTHALVSLKETATIIKVEKSLTKVGYGGIKEVRILGDPSRDKENIFVGKKRHHDHYKPYKAKLEH